MRYIADSSGYLKEVAFGCQLSCGGEDCTEYTGSVPEGYTTLEAWYLEESDKLYRWRIVDGNLTLDSSAVAPVEANLLSQIDTLFNNNKFSTGGLTEGADRFDIVSGGYKQVGKLCIVQLELTAKVTLTANDYWTIFTGFPPPANTYTALSAAMYAGLAPMSAYIVGNSLGLVLGNQNIVAGKTVLITGMYMTA